MKANTNTYTVTQVRTEAPGIQTLSLDGVPLFTPGQFINIFFPDTNTPEGKAYSLSSTPQEGAEITIKEIGEFSGKLCRMREGDTFEASDPYGFFYPEYEDSDLVLLAGGIGVTPFKGIIEQALKTNPKRPVTLLHSVRLQEECIFDECFSKLDIEREYFVTRDQNVRLGAHPRRMNAEDVLRHKREGKQTEILICGSIDFTRSLWRELRENGVSEDELYTEAFFSH